MSARARPAEAAATTPPSIAADTILTALWQYWESKRASRRMPLRREIDPCEIPRLLPYLQLVELVAGRGFRYRLTGTAIADGYGFDATGKFTHEVLPPARHAVANRHYALVSETGRPLFARNRYVKGNSTTVIISRIILPLATDGAGARILLLGQTFAAPLPEQPMTVETAIDLEADEMEFLDKAKLSLVSSADTIAASR